MKVIIFGATGMVGQGVLRECLLDADVDGVLAIVRNSSLPKHEVASDLPTLPKEALELSRDAARKARMYRNCRWE